MVLSQDRISALAWRLKQLHVPKIVGRQEAPQFHITGLPIPVETGLTKVFLFAVLLASWTHVPDPPWSSPEARYHQCFMSIL